MLFYIYNVSGDKMIGVQMWMPLKQVATVVPTAWNTAYGLGT